MTPSTSRPGARGAARPAAHAPAPVGAARDAGSAHSATPAERAGTPEDAPPLGSVQGALRSFAAIWCRAVYPTTQTSLTQEELQARLLDLTDRLRLALHAEPFDPSPGRAVGAALVEAHCTDPDALTQSLGVLEAYLPLYFPPETPRQTARPTGEEIRTRSARLQHAVAAGFAQRLRERTHTEQEAILHAALSTRDEAAVALHASEARFRAVFQEAAVGIAVADLDGNVLEINDALAGMFGGSPKQLVGHHAYDFEHPLDGPEVWSLYRELVQGEREHYRIEKPYARFDGSVFWADVTCSLIRDAAGAPLWQLAVVQDITERRMLQKLLRHQATHDSLTGLPNRALFLERLEQALDPESPIRRIGVCYLDLDGFKTVNDSLGHDTGDRLLVEVADRFRACLAGPQQLVARMGGDEFIALVVDPAGESEVVALAQRFLDALDQPVVVDGQDLKVTVSVGVLEGPASALDVGRAVQGADITLYRAKAAGGNRWAVSDPETNQREIARHTLATHLPGALERGEFFVEYQPVVSLADGRIRGAEALVRWRHPEHGVLGPDRFVPLAERTGLIVPLGRWVLEQACRQAKAWQESLGDPDLRVNVNLSPRQVRGPALLADVRHALAESGLNASSLCLEVTESALIGADSHVIGALRELADLGITLALDDFGTGYANFSHLRRMPVHCLKIDRSFVGGVAALPAEGALEPALVGGVAAPDGVDAKLVSGMVSLARSLDLAVTAEGIETAEQAQRLHELGCDTAQGWYYAKPGPPERLVALSREHARTAPRPVAPTRPGRPD